MAKEKLNGLLSQVEVKVAVLLRVATGVAAEEQVVIVLTHQLQWEQELLLLL
jgi:hypothetical protein